MGKETNNPNQVAKRLPIQKSHKSQSFRRKIYMSLLSSSLLTHFFLIRVLKSLLYLTSIEPRTITVETPSNARPH